ncbi:PTS lactose/cellobiose transporter subunit IIA [Melissococcus plutonius]|uniref:PTS system lactose-specific EIIA component n=1 Tax=Melissococcus plutonius TaxID=33970 RepID=A0A2Z5Y4J6_9ENTE|nr:PTS lactose/cellobiose transporter subunit IIA [Melissococcus plutonius]BAL62895.1 phosphotransferase system PTS protein [Melissococcus plutonius DAT561]MCV2499558.1 PTS lactose/cellobiose transporter subunit IIA [Melissococcus plutonius]MCV2501845.1 PTS lactose/cellobiose transporter subunit IIA [Melissococcus plutonius]MCV2505848.1 PTS lactose/cellobiose transporter subunit IIA [Melissococcus plutonius]MCV2508126.1 PTS lactose/cellobiose transporter subunit IIA [Melissococcus plutonius]
MNKEEVQLLGFEIVAYSGDARSELLTLLNETRQGNFEHVNEHLKNVDENLKLAHNSQTQTLADEAAGKNMEMGFIFIHGQDHLMTTLLFRDLIQDFIELYREKYQKN